MAVDHHGSPHIDDYPCQLRELDVIRATHG